jgi:hypothetical protein
MPPGKFRLRPQTLIAAAAAGRTGPASRGTSASPPPPRTAQSPPTQASACKGPVEDNYLTAGPSQAGVLLVRTGPAAAIAIAGAGCPDPLDLPDPD